MESEKYLIDTNTVIDYLENKLPISGMDLLNHIIDKIISKISPSFRNSMQIPHLVNLPTIKRRSFRLGAIGMFTRSFISEGFNDLRIFKLLI